MANYIVKITPHTDAYVYWSHEQGLPHFGGTRAELTKHLADCAEDSQLDERFARADATGTSAKPWQDEQDVTHPGFYAWDEPGADTFITEQRGQVRREDLMELWRCVGVGRPYPHILHPLDDGTLIGWHEPTSGI